MEQTSKSLSCNIDDNYHPSSTINLCRYLAEHYEDEFISAAGDSGLTYSGQMSAVETASLMSDVQSISSLKYSNCGKAYSFNILSLTMMTKF